jgi:hypothetical protein
MYYFYLAPYTITAFILMVILLFIKAKRHAAFITDKNIRQFILYLSVLLILTSVIGSIVLGIKGEKWESIDVFVSLFFFGMFITGLVSETSKDKSDSVL